MNCCAVALSLFFSDILTWNAALFIFSEMTHKLRGVHEKNMYIMSTNFAKMLVWKHEYDVKL